MEWECGEIIIPGREWSDFRTTVISAWNDLQDERLARAKALHKSLKQVVKGKRGPTRVQALSEYLSNRNDVDWGLVSTVVVSVDPVNLKAPFRADYPQLPTSRSCTIEGPGFVLGLDNNDRRVLWEVYEGNHAVDDAHEHPFVRALFRELANVEWGRNSGGTIAGNDEYNRDDHEPDGGTNYVNYRFGPLGKD